ncbi:MAG: GNAT family N-acetyltransferase [Pseudomonadota bacterium]
MNLLIKTLRLTLRPWEDHDRDTFAALHADPDVMQDLRTTLSRAESDAKFDRYRQAYLTDGYCRWAAEAASGEVLGYAGLMQAPADHPLGPHADIAWRFSRDAWGAGYATEAASGALQDGFERVGLSQVYAYTDANNMKAQAVMRRLGLHPEPTLDFTIGTQGRQLVWSAHPHGVRIARRGG